MKKSQIHIINLVILFVYMVVITAAYKDGVLILSVLPIALHVLINFILFLVNISSDRPIGLTYLLSSLLVLLIGFSSCLGLSNLGTGLNL